MKEVKKINSLKLKMDFNDICLRELELGVVGMDGDDYDDESYDPLYYKCMGYIYDMDSMEILKVKDKFLKYPEEVVPIINAHEKEFNLIEDCRLFEALFGRFAERYAAERGWRIIGYSHIKVTGSIACTFSLTYVDPKTGSIECINSDAFYNEPVRVLSLLLHMKSRSHIYDLDRFDVSIVQ